jgi:hypothetical protein
MPSADAALVVAIDQIARRMLEDILTEATRLYWHRRADTFTQARPRPGDWPGLDPDPELDARLAATAAACRAKAQFQDGESWPA